MMPSRGLHVARGHAPRLYQLQCRNLSSASRRIPQHPFRSNARTPLQPSQWPKSSHTLPSIRHASSTPQAAGQAASSTGSPHEAASAATSPANPIAEPAFSEPAFSKLDTVTIDDLSVVDIGKIPEGLGYLKEIGIDYGWGPTGALQWTIEHLHVVAGLPWWGSLAVTAVLMRLALFPLFLKSSDMMARQAAIGSLLKPITEKMKVAQAAGDQQAMMMAWQETLAIRRRAGVRFRDQLLPMIFQGVLGFCGFRLIRSMVALPVPAFLTEGPLWLQDMTLSDPYLLLPAFMAGTIHMLVRMGGESGAQSTTQMPAGMMKFMLYGMPALIFVAMGWQSGALCIWFTATGAVGISQSLLLQRPAVRRVFGLAPLYKPSEDEKDEGFMAFLRSKSTPSAAAKKGPSEGKNTAYMNPTYQSPNLRRKTAFRKPSDFIDTTATTRPRTQHTQAPASESERASQNVRGSHEEAEEMVQANPSPGSVLQKASDAWSNYKRGVKERKAQVDAEQAKKRVQRNAENYEKRAQAQARERRGGGP